MQYTAVGGSARPVRGSVHVGEKGHRGSRGISCPKHKGGGGEVGVEEKGSGGKGRTREWPSLSFVVQMLAATVGAGRGS